MLGLLKRKKKKNKDEDKPLAKGDKDKNLKQTLDEELDKEKKRKQKKEKEGPNAAAFFVLIITISAGLFFFIYGRISQFGLSGLMPQLPEKKTMDQLPNSPKTPNPLPQNSDGVIIFEK